MFWISKNVFIWNTISEDGDEETICFYGDSYIDGIECIPEMNNDSKYYSTILFYLLIL